MRRNGICHIMIPCLPGSYDWQQDEADGEQVEPQDEKHHERETFIEVSPVDQFEKDERECDEKADEGRGFEMGEVVFHGSPFKRLRPAL